MEKVELKKGIYWVGAIDWNIRDFHGYSTPYGTTYNAYLILDEKNVLVDTVKAPFYLEMLGRISEIIDPSRIDVVVSNHVEMDHSGSLLQIVERIGSPTVITSERGQKGLMKHYKKSPKFKVVKSGETFSTGHRTLTFVEAPMLHWPDSMFTYIKEDQLLLPNDAFGQHVATCQRFEDEIVEGVMKHASKYYANILWPLAPLILKKVDEVVKMGIPIDMIGPSHGLIWRKDPGRIIQAYVNWSQGKAGNKILVVYDTMWGSTESIAKAILKGLVEEGAEARLLHLRSNHRSDIVEEMLEAKGILLGSPTLNNGMFPTMGDFLTYVSGLRPKGKVFGLFGSHGWGGGAIKEMRRVLEKDKFEVWEKELPVQYVPDPDELKNAIQFGKEFAQKLQVSKVS
ncbi:MAG TPA: FprA family A-type flavoprotein [Thermodesulfobacteriota bacterium]|nr:FprA family A-type flavoprotein [Thermodesulfobacteriota bacterium]